MGESSSLHNLRRTGRYVAVLMTAMLSHCVCQNNRPDEPHATGGTAKAEGGAGQGPALPAALDISELDGDERRVLRGVLMDQYDPCGAQRSFLDSLKDEGTCELAHELGAMAVRKVSQGLAKRQIVRQLLEELARRAAKADLALDGVPHLGDPATAPHVIVEFTDFECGYCKDAAQPVKELARAHGAALYVKMFPIDDHHPHARAAALAALAAHRQGKFWEAFDALFKAQDDIRADGGAIRVAIAEAGLDMARFDADVASPEVAAALARDLAEVKRFGVGGTPTFFVDGYLVDRRGLQAALAAPKRE